MRGAMSFFLAVLPHWTSIITGSIVAAVLGLLSFGGYQFPSWLVWLFATGGILRACYLAWRDERANVAETASRLTPRLSINQITRAAGGHYRVEVRNISASSVRVRAQLESIIPDSPQPLPLNLKATGYDATYEVEVPAGGFQLFDVFLANLHDTVFVKRGSHRAMAQGDDPHAIFLVDSPYHTLIQRQRYTIVICGFPVLPEGGAPARRSFYIIPQPDSSIIFSDAGPVD